METAKQLRSTTSYHHEDKLTTLTCSSWVEEMRADTQKQWREKWAMHNYMIYLDSAGCFEVIADSSRPSEADRVVLTGL